MLSAARRFLEKHIGLPGAGADEDADGRINLAVAALLVEVLRADYDVSAPERRQVLTSMRQILSLPEETAEQLLSLAEEEIDKSHDLYQFTSQVNRAFGAEQKRQLVEQLWRVAQADQIVHKYEEHIIRRVADLLHVPHSVFIAAKLRAGA
jgi:uncharacterized tellurite resistance protein B-like protein